MHSDPRQLRSQMRLAAEPFCDSATPPTSPDHASEVTDLSRATVGTSLRTRLLVGALVVGSVSALISQRNGHEVPNKSADDSRFAYPAVTTLGDSVLDAFRAKRYDEALKQYFTFHELCNQRRSILGSDNLIPQSELDRLDWLLSCTLTAVVNEYHSDQDNAQRNYSGISAIQIERLSQTISACLLAHGYRKTFVMRLPLSTDLNSLTEDNLSHYCETVAYSRRAISSLKDCEIFLPHKISDNGELLTFIPSLSTRD